MGVLTDYIFRTRQPQQPVSQPQQNGYTYTGPQRNPNDIMVAQGIRENTYYSQQPQVDTSNAIGSLAEILGPTPAEREARERRLQESKARMSAWTGLFDGLRQLGNLYYASRGATPQQLSSPYQQIDQHINEQRAIQDASDNYRRQYAQSMYNLRRQMSDDARRDLLAKAQADYYGTRDEVARMKAENDRLKNEKYIELQDGRIAKLNAETGQIEQLLPYKQQEIESRISKNNKQASIIGAPVTTTTNGPKGTTVSTKTYGRGRGGGAKKGKTIAGYQKSGNGGNSGKGKLY